MSFRSAFSQHKIIAYTILSGWIILTVALLGRVNPVEGSVVSEFISEPLGGLLLWFLALAALPAMAAGFVVIGSVDHLFNVYGVFGYFVMVVVACMVQTLIYGLLGKFLGRIFRKHSMDVGKSSK